MLRNSKAWFSHDEFLEEKAPSIRVHPDNAESSMLHIQYDPSLIREGVDHSHEKLVRVVVVVMVIDVQPPIKVIASVTERGKGEDEGAPRTAVLQPFPVHPLHDSEGFCLLM